MRVVIADDAVILREGLARLLTEAGFAVVGLAGDAQQLLALVEEQRPDVAIVDIRMPPTHTNEGLHAAREIRARWPEVGIIVLSQYLQPSYAFELLQSGAEGIGYLLKNRLSLMAEGKSNKAIGETLWITERTVEKHVNSIFAKLRLTSSPDEHRRVLAALSYLEAR